MKRYEALTGEECPQGHWFGVVTAPTDGDLWCSHCHAWVAPVVVEFVRADVARGAVEARDNAEAIVTALCELTGEPTPDGALKAVRLALHDHGGR